jgi:hypothetical protein
MKHGQFSTSISEVRQHHIIAKEIENTNQNAFTHYEAFLNIEK